MSTITNEQLERAMAEAREMANFVLEIQSLLSDASEIKDMNHKQIYRLSVEKVEKMKAKLIDLEKEESQKIAKVKEDTLKVFKREIDKCYEETAKRDSDVLDLKFSLARANTRIEELEKKLSDAMQENKSLKEVATKPPVSGSTAETLAKALDSCAAETTELLRRVEEQEKKLKTQEELIERYRNSYNEDNEQMMKHALTICDLKAEVIAKEKQLLELYNGNKKFEEEKNKKIDDLGQVLLQANQYHEETITKLRTCEQDLEKVKKELEATKKEFAEFRKEYEYDVVEPSQ